MQMSETKSSEKLVPLEENHELHGALIGVGTVLVLKTVTNLSLQSSLSIGALTGAVATAGMKTFGHPFKGNQSTL